MILKQVCSHHFNVCCSMREVRQHPWKLLDCVIQLLVKIAGGVVLMCAAGHSEQLNTAFLQATPPAWQLRDERSSSNTPLGSKSNNARAQFWSKPQRQLSTPYLDSGPAPPQSRKTTDGGSLQSLRSDTYSSRTETRAQQSSSSQLVLGRAASAQPAKTRVGDPLYAFLLVPQVVFTSA